VTTLQPFSEFKLSWTVTPDTGYIAFEFAGPSDGWIGIGFSPKSPIFSMIGTRAVIGWRDEIGNVIFLHNFICGNKTSLFFCFLSPAYFPKHVQEFALNGYNVSQIEPTNDLSIATTRFTYQNGISKIQFKIPWNPLAQKYVLVGDWTTVLAAYGDSAFPSMHVERVLLPIVRSLLRIIL
jgi:hypothetical protein